MMIMMVDEGSVRVKEYIYIALVTARLRNVVEDGESCFPATTLELATSCVSHAYRASFLNPPLNKNTRQS